MQDDYDASQETGLVEDLPLLSLDVKDRELIENFRRWESDSKSFWDDSNGYNLSARRKRNFEYYLGKQLDVDNMYHYQVPYVDNQLFVATEAITAYTTASEPSAEVQPEDESVQSKIMAEELEWALNVHTQKFKLSSKMEAVEKSMYLKYVGVIKLYYDAELDDIVPRVIDPDDIVLDKNCRLGENPLFICERCTATAQQIINMFPDKKDDFMEHIHRQRMSSKLLNSTYAYKEVWFTQIDDDGETECVAWYMDDLLLGKAKNPNYIYSDEGLAISNHVDKPMKPYAFFNYMNDGSHLIDQTTPFEQAIPLQDILNKRGRQIVENADTANPVLVLKSGALPSGEAQNITRDPNQILLLQSQGERPITDAFSEIPPHMLPNYVLNDKQDIKDTIHSIMGTPSQFRGANDNDTGTLGEARMLKNQASGRQDAIIRALERGLDDYYKILVQMMKVWYKNTKKFGCRNNDGKFMLVELSRQRIPDISYVGVEHGTTQMQDKAEQRQTAMTLAQLGLIDPYNLFKMLGLKNADSLYDALVKFKMSPDALAQELKSDMQDRQAYADFACIMNGEKIDAHEDVGPEHILAHRTQITTDKFLYAKPERQKAMLDHIQEEVFMLSQRTKLQEASMQGLLLDPNMPITPEVPEPMPPMPGPMPGMPAGPQGMPPAGPQGGMMGPNSAGDQMMAQQMPEQAPQPGPRGPNGPMAM